MQDFQISNAIRSNNLESCKEWCVNLFEAFDSQQTTWWSHEKLLRWYLKWYIFLLVVTVEHLILLMKIDPVSCLITKGKNWAWEKWITGFDEIITICTTTKYTKDVKFTNFYKVHLFGRDSLHLHSVLKSLVTNTLQF